MTNGPNNTLLFIQRQFVICANSDLLSIGPLRTNVSETDENRKYMWNPKFHVMHAQTYYRIASWFYLF